MKASAAQLGAALDRPGGDIRLFLLHGPDEAGALDYASRLGRALPGAERVDLDGAALKARPATLADEAASLSLFGDKRYIRVSGMGEESLTAVTLLLDAATAGNPAIAIAPSLKASGKLVKLALSSRRAMAFACYPLEGDGDIRLTTAIARDHGLRLDGQAPAALFQTAGGDRAVLTREIEKLALYLDAAPERPRDASIDDIAAVGANLSDSEIGGAVAAIVDGRPDLLGPELAALDAAGMTIPLLRSVARRLMALAEMRGEVDGGASPDSVVEAHRVFWKEKSSTTHALARWSSAAIARGLERVRLAERAVMLGGAAGAVTALQHMLSLARSAARPR